MKELNLILVAFLLMHSFSLKAGLKEKQIEEYKDVFYEKIRSSRDITDQIFQMAKDFHTLDETDARRPLLTVSSSLQL